MQACEHYCGDIPRSLVGFLRAQGPKVPYSVSDSGISADPKRQDVCLKKKRSFFPSLFTGTVSYIESELTESLKDRQGRTMCEELFRHT